MLEHWLCLHSEKQLCDVLTQIEREHSFEKYLLFSKIIVEKSVKIKKVNFILFQYLYIIKLLY